MPGGAMPGGAMPGGGIPPTMCGPMNMHMLQQQLGMAAQGMRPEMRGMMPQQPPRRSACAPADRGKRGSHHASQGPVPKKMAAAPEIAVLQLQGSIGRPILASSLERRLRAPAAELQQASYGSQSQQPERRARRDMMPRDTTMPRTCLTLAC